MKRVPIVVLACAALVAFSAAAMAQEVQYNVTVQGGAVKGSPGDHFVTFSGPVQIPDVTLPAGTYVFSFVGPSIVQVTSADRVQKYALFFTLPAERAEATEGYAMSIVPTMPTAPGRITEWYLPNQTNGFEFLYSAAEARGDR